MSSTSPTIGLKIPEGSDPFLTEDFASNLQKIDQAFAQRPPSGGGQVDAATLGGSPKSYFYGPHNPPPATGVGSHTHADYALAGHTHPGGGTTDLSNYYTKAETDQRIAAAGGGSSYTLPSDVMKAPNRTNPRTIFSVTGVTFNNANGVGGILIDYSALGFPTPPTVVLTAEVGSNFDMITNVQARNSSNCTVRMARVTGQTGTHTAQLHWFVVGV